MNRPIALAPLAALVLCALAPQASAQFAGIDPTKVRKVTASRLNVRSGPSTRYAVVGTLTRGKVVYVLRVANGWAEILFAQKRRFTSARYLAISSGAGRAPAPRPAAPAIGTFAARTYEVVWSVVNVRKGPGTSHAVVASYRRGQTFSVTRSSGSWLGNASRWIYGPALKRSAASATPRRPAQTAPARPAPAPPSTRPVLMGRAVAEYLQTVRGNGAALRTTARPTGTKIRSLIKGQVLRVFRVSGSYLGVRQTTRGPLLGWVYKGLLRATVLTPEPDKAPAPVVTKSDRGSGNKRVGSSNLGARVVRETVVSHDRRTSTISETCNFTGRLLGRTPRLGGLRTQVKSDNSTNRVQTKFFKVEVLANEFTVNVPLLKTFPWLKEKTLWTGPLGPVRISLKVEAGLSVGLSPRVAAEGGGVSVGLQGSIAVFGTGDVGFDAGLVRAGVEGTLNVVEISLPATFTLRRRGVDFNVDFVISSNIGVGLYVIVGRKVKAGFGLFGPKVGFEEKFTLSIPFLQFTLAEVRIPVASGTVIGS
jgi:uncharacterized protein YraI